MPRVIMVFGSNTGGRHGKGVALLAKQNWGAKQFQPDGMMGDSYGICTRHYDKDTYKLHTLSLDVIQYNIYKFEQDVKRYPKRMFAVTALGTGLAGCRPKAIASLFLETPDMDNVFFPTSFIAVNSKMKRDKWSFNVRHELNPLLATMQLLYKEKHNV